MERHLWDVIQGIPPVTRTYLGVSFAFCSLVGCGQFSNNPSDWGLSFAKIFKYGQVYRLFTSIMYDGALRWELPFTWLRVGSVMTFLERKYENAWSFVWLIVLMALSNYVAAYFLLNCTDNTLLNAHFMFAVYYLSVRRFPNGDHVMMGLVTIKAKYILIMLYLFSFYSVWYFIAGYQGSLDGCVGILAGHLVFLGYDLVPPLFNGINVLQPIWEWTFVKRVFMPMKTLLLSTGLFAHADQVVLVQLDDDGVEGPVEVPVAVATGFELGNDDGLALRDLGGEEAVEE
ncbi:unnamed protein product [Kuraishia capsulata CBS 1993]|uniref:Derlin n=1 Tax=Kuraishia capsulata CBS 1993 TaxID=1382522 RepID=W6MUN6_9ASCO|nr:uncharacterized protein KUCA_T00005420001 [Kuraishia capsulata CBS 1993]CDK29432.1 unnamed protein product [Kuraishia capsulata CBS 1993]